MQKRFCDLCDAQLPAGPKLMHYLAAGEGRMFEAELKNVTQTVTYEVCPRCLLAELRVAADALEAKLD